MATTQQLIAELSAEQRQTLLARLKARPRDRETPARGQVAMPRVEPMGEARFEPFPLTDIQQAYWVGRQSAFNLGNIAAHGYLELDCRELDLPRLENAFNRLIVRHDMMRAVVNPDGRQQILREVPAYRFTTLDLRDVLPDARAGHLAAVRREMSHQVLDATTWPLFDIRATFLPEGCTRLHLSIDVLIFDALSFDILSEELRHLYQGGGEPPPLALSYADYVRGLSLLKETELYRESRAYWREKIKQLPPAPDFPLAVAPESIARPEFRRLSGRMDKVCWGRLKAHAQRLGVTPSAVLLAAYGAIVARWNGRKRFTLNLTLFNRLPFHPEVNSLVGDFTSVILLELDYSVPASFAQRVKSVQEQLWRDMDHRHVSGVQVLRELTEQTRDTNATQMPVVFTSAIKPTAADDSPAAMSWLGEVHYTITQTPQVWLDHQITEDAGELEYDWDAVRGLFPEGFLEAMFDGYRHLIEALAQDEPLWQRREFEILPLAQRQLIAGANATTAPVPPDLLHEPFIRRAWVEPERTAVIDAETAVTYGELYRLSNGLAHRLWQTGTGTGELVGILLPKGRWQVVAALGILEAGGAYLPIETGYGEDRIAQLVRLSGLRRVITQGSVPASRHLPAGVEVLLVDDLANSPHEAKPLPAMRRPTDLAYVIYTSGSTGTPKGVMIDHRGALNTCADINQRFAVGPGDRVLGLSALNFDLSVYDIFGLLAAGGALVIPHPDKLRDPAHWDEMIRHHGVTLWNTVPALVDIYATYLIEVARHENHGLRLVMMSGDWIPLQLPEAIRRCCPAAAPVSLGGATEASIWSILFPIDEVSPDWRSIPYGKAMLNQSVQVLDEHLQPCPVWVPGELFIGGVGIAKGYWRDPERTAAQFISHPRTGEKLYRTGDLGCWLPCGNIEFLGRKDFQVKINGFRVELGEVEVNMSHFSGVKAAVCAVSGGTGRFRQLVGYYVRDPEKPASAKDEGDKLRFRRSEPGLRRFAGEAEEIVLAADPDFAEIHYRRRSQRLFPDAALSLEQLGGLLSHLRRSPYSPSPKYRYGSAGSLYPVQVYVYAAPGRITGLSGGMYYYDPAKHRLVRLTEDASIDAGYYGSWNADMVNSAAFHLLLIADLDAIEPLYGDDSMHLCRIESGLMTQILEQEAHRFGLGLCQVGGFDFERARPLFRFEHRTAYLHALVGGGELGEAELLELAAVRARAKDSDEGFEARLREYLRKKLPDYMVPAVFMRLPELPLSTNGKVDRKALPQPRKETMSTPANPVVSDTDLGKQIRAVWRDALGVDDVGINDNFFDLGGTSVDMIKIHTRLRPILPKEVQLLDMFFVYPTIAALVEHLQPRQSAPSAIVRVDSRAERAGRARAARRQSDAE